MPITLPYAEDFEAGVVGQALADTAAYVVAGANGTATFVDTDTAGGTRAVRFAATGGQRYLATVLETDREDLWVSFVDTMPADDPPSLVYLGAIIGAGGGRIVDFRVNTDRTLQLRQNSVATGIPASPPIPPGTVFRWSLYGRPGNANGARLRLYIGANLHGTVPDFETPVVASTSTETLVRSARVGIGVTTGITGTWAITGDRLRVATTEPAGSTTAPAAPALTGVARPGAVDLSWVLGGTGGTAIASQTLERSTRATDGFAPLTPAPAANATTYTDSTVVNGTSYYYRLRVTNAGGSTSPYSEVTGPHRPAAAGTTRVKPVSDVSLLGATLVPEGATTAASVLSDDDPVTLVRIARGGRVRVRLGAIPAGPYNPTASAVQVRVSLDGGHRGTLTATLYQGTDFLWTGEGIVDAEAGGVFVMRLPNAAVAAIGAGSDLELELQQT